MQLKQCVVVLLQARAMMLMRHEQHMDISTQCSYAIVLWCCCRHET